MYHSGNKQQEGVQGLPGLYNVTLSLKKKVQGVMNGILNLMRMDIS